MITVKDIKNKRIKGAWKGRIQLEPKTEGIVTTSIVKLEENKPSKNK